jgi:hypothetical protein
MTDNQSINICDLLHTPTMGWEKTKAGWQPIHRRKTTGNCLQELWIIIYKCHVRLHLNLVQHMNFRNKVRIEHKRLNKKPYRPLDIIQSPSNLLDLLGMFTESTVTRVEDNS